MARENYTRSGCKDVFHAFMVETAAFSGALEMPCVKKQNQLPNRLVPFSKAIGGNDYNRWIHFYEDDAAFERIWNHPNKYLPILQRYRGVISPDFSLYRDMPLVMQAWNTYRNRAVAHWLQENGVPVIPNIRWGDERSFSFCCDGIDAGGTIAEGPTAVSSSCMNGNTSSRGSIMWFAHFILIRSLYMARHQIQSSMNTERLILPSTSLTAIMLSPTKRW